MTTLRWLFALIRPHRAALRLATLGSVLLALGFVLVLPLFNDLLAAFGADAAALDRAVLAAGLYAILLSGLSYAQAVSSASLGERLAAELRRLTFTHLLRLAMDFHVRRDTGDLLTRINHDVTAVAAAFEYAISQFLPNCLTPLLVIGYLLYLDWRLTLLVVLLLPVFVLLTAVNGRWMRGVAGQSAAALGRFNSRLLEVLGNIATVKTSGAEAAETALLGQANACVRDLGLRRARIGSIQTPLVLVSQLLVVIAVLWFSGRRLLNGDLSVPQLATFLLGLGLLIDPFSVLSRINLHRSRALASLARLHALLALTPQITDAPQARPLCLKTGEIRFSGVGFRYPDQAEPALVDLDLTVPGGQLVALVGPSGAGKTTLLHLLLRLHAPDRGCIAIDGQPIDTLTRESLYRDIAIVTQRPGLFSASVRDNIAYGCDRDGAPPVAQAAIEHAARIAFADEFIRALPQGYDTPVGEQGVRLSAGECQRLLLARALLREPRILLLDEVTAHLDAGSERLVRQAMARWLPGRTALVVAHRLSSIRAADLILVLERGRIVQRGTHAQLRCEAGLYRRLWEQQHPDESP